jgi:hypothetical protein
MNAEISFNCLRSDGSVTLQKRRFLFPDVTLQYKYSAAFCTVLRNLYATTHDPMYETLLTKITELMSTKNKAEIVRLLLNSTMNEVMWTEQDNILMLVVQTPHEVFTLIKQTEQDSLPTLMEAVFDMFPKLVHTLQ